MSLFRRRLMMAGSSESVETLLISLDTNQDDDSVLIGKRVTVSYGVTEKTLEWRGQTMSIDIPGETVCSVFFPAVDGYKTPEALSFTTVGETTRSISGMYNTEIVKVKAVFGNGGVITGQPVNINGKLVTTNLSGIATSMVPYGKIYDIIPSAKPDYDTPESIIGRTASQKEYSTTFTYIKTSSRQEVVNIDLKTNQASSSDINGVNINLKYGEVDKNLTWRGSRLTEAVPEGEVYTLTFSGVKDYKTPNQQSYTAVGGNIRPVQALYETEVVEVTVSADDGAPIAGQIVTINSEPHQVGSSGVVRQKVAFGLRYSIFIDTKQGYTTPKPQTYTSSQALRPVSMIYRVESVKNEVVNIDITSNQNAPLLFNGTSITLEYGGRYKYFTWNGSTITVEIQEGVSYTVSVDDVVGFKTPSSFSETAVGGYTRPVTMEYEAELLWVNVVDSQGNALTGQTVSCDVTGESYTSQTYPVSFYVPMGSYYNISVDSRAGYNTPKPYSGVADSKNKSIRIVYSKEMQLKVIAKLDDGSPAYSHSFYMNDEPYRLNSKGEALIAISKSNEGKTYNIRMDAIPGYTTPKPQTYIANKPYTEVNFLFVKESDVDIAILRTDGNYYHRNEWSFPNSEAVGVSVKTPKSKFLIALDNITESGLMWSPDGDKSLVSGCTTTNVSEEAIVDYWGPDNTNGITEYYRHSLGNYAAKSCSEYSFSSGARAYLGALGEWKIVGMNISEINNCLALVGGTQIDVSNKYWTSTQQDQYAAYVIDFNIMTSAYGKQYDAFPVRAFGVIY